VKPIRESGPWPFASPVPSFPAVVTIEGREYRRADRLAEPRAGVVAQYRENRRRWSRHLFVVDEGRSYRIEHVDAWNPQAGPFAAALHFLVDHPLGRRIRGA
jgi:hypothetical protein